ncbi:MAG: glycerol-3-phosphate 1-O-acyltransferase PlsY [Ignavibacteriota bacterium]|jgi:glycerol-3-phosphate acyltransferase PlsY|nr:MAG: glycerol-3-phosphate 1-O-acyltransferase [Chlorobiota bacterium]MBE7476163.1 glycerol-3-phosphate 1-O-acyltransferase PlsY [Ignavibacteriales bacterium]MBL1124154.1 glycerol-3-phosphate 1-O-acyltransferase [Ignavibacteriota bacterium]MBV6421075.1 Glycerol-3-phosphate acyltransferase [Ignavibacteriaceae bacterium]MCE7857657.1 glycerol-3-phosphate 1-O-acyltransferase [Ignavibacteria bacterium CHB3]MEB2297384.1 glycerol-3-phosphate 1-O-acyltransferase PlsY [Ignavibacteria bacterium]
MFLLAIIVILSYLIGSIPNSIIISKAVSGIDIRKHGSGNAGGTNVLRVLGWKYGLIVIFLDALKGAIAVVLIARLFYGPLPFENVSPFDDFTLIQIIAGMSAVIGHIWTVFAGFKGGKGIATALGMLLTLITVDMLIAVGVFTLVVLISRYVSLGSIIAAISVPATLFIRENLFHVDIPGYSTLFPFILGITALVIFTHRKNLIRLLRGNENKISFRKKNKIS